jgi:signal peptidase I
MATKSTSLWIEALQTIGLSIFFALGTRQFVAEARYIPTGSMEPTLQINDRLVIEKISYHFNPPQRGDIVVFGPPEMAISQTGRPKEVYIKRVIGLPGDTVEVKDQTVWVNGEALRETYIKAPTQYQWGPETVPTDAYLVLGDNRNNSFDSHVWGFVPQKNIIGRAVVRFWPPERLGGLDREP